MNFLAHFHLARPTDPSRVGALLADFVRGTQNSLLERYPADLVEGIMLHRTIDSFTDRHPVFLECKAYLAPERRRFAGIIIDVFFDHFLTQQWQEFSTQPLPAFISETYGILDRNHQWLTPDLQSNLPRMKSENWLDSYGTLEGLALTFRRISRRRDFLAPLVGSEEDLISNYSSFEQGFRSFYPELIEHTRSYHP